MFRLDDFQLVLDGHFSEDWAHKERDEPLESIYVMTGRDIEPAKYKKGIRVFELTCILEIFSGMYSLEAMEGFSKDIILSTYRDFNFLSWLAVEVSSKYVVEIFAFYFFPSQRKPKCNLSLM